MARTPVGLTGTITTDALLWGFKWEFTNLTYSIPNDFTGYIAYFNNGGNIFGFQSMNTADFAPDIAKVVKNFSAVSGLEITLGGGVTTLRYAQVDTLSDGTKPFHYPGTQNDDPGNAPGSAEAHPPDPLNFPDFSHGDTWYNKAFSNADPGTFEYAAWMLHETGHAVGLKHGHQTQTINGINFPALPAGNDSQEYSIMTYRRYVGQPEDANGRLIGDNASDYPTTLMMFDIRALQILYGADYSASANNGNTVYKWGPTNGNFIINGVGQGGHAHGNKIFMTIWDGGGTDTYDLSNYGTRAVKIDLGAGKWSTFSQTQLADLDKSANPGDHLARGNVANALLFFGDLRALIENARGANGNDSIIGNQVKNTLLGNGGHDFIRGLQGNDILAGGSGNDVLDGGAGFDILTGSSGRDTFIFRTLQESRVSSTTSDFIRDFRSDDRIQVSHIDAISGSGNQRFEFIGKAGFDDPGQVRYIHTRGDTWVQFNTDRDRAAEMLVRLDGTKTLFADDFIL